MAGVNDLRYLYKLELEDIIRPLEKYRKAKFKRIKTFLLFAFLSIVLLLISIFLSLTPALIGLAALAAFVLLILANGEFQNLKKKQRLVFKKEVIFRILDFIFLDFEYIPRQKISNKVIFKSNLIDSSSDIHGEDFMQFTLGKTRIMFSETTVFQSNDNIPFQGVFVSSTFNKHFNSVTYVISRANLPLIRGLKFKSPHLEDIVLEDGEFNSNYKVLSNNQVEARYILSPSFMNRILDYQKKLDKRLSFSFIQNRMYCTIPNQTNLFEPPVLHKMDFNCIEKNYLPVKLYTDLVEDLNLNLRIWSKA